MSQPTLVRWVSAQFAPIATGTLTDPYSREARATSTHGATVSIRAQVDSGGRTRTRGAGGEDSQILKVALVRKLDATDAGWTPRCGDRYTGAINRLGTTIDTEILYVVRVRSLTAGFSGDGYWQLGLGDDAPARKAA